MSRRLWCPAGACGAFAAVALLVAGGLAWVTVASLRVEDAHRRATARADWVNRERLALWRLDGRLLPAVGLESARPFAHYAALNPGYPAVDLDNEVPAFAALRLPSPLLSADLPDWMLLHFQVDEESGWTSPQVLPGELAARLRGPPLWLDLPNVTPDRERRLADLRARFPVPQTLAALAERDKTAPADSPFVVPFPLVDETAAAKPAMTPADDDATARPAADPDESPGTDRPAKSESAPPPDAPAPPRPPAPAAAFVGPPAQRAQNAALEEQRFRQELADRVYQNRGAYEPPAGFARNAAAGSGGGGFDKLKEGPPLTKSAAAPAPAAEKLQAMQLASPMPKAGAMSAAVADPQGDAKQAEAGKKMEDAVRKSSPAAAAELRSQSTGRWDLGGLLFGEGKPAGDAAIDLSRTKRELAPPVAAAAPGVPEAKQTRAEQQETERLARGLSRRDVKDAFLDDDRVRPPVFDGPAGARKPAPAVRPAAVHLSPLRPQWLAAPDGSEALVLVRAARLEHATVYQGVLLDWPRLRESLVRQVSDLFPAASLEPVRPTDPPTPERAMTALPAVLDPGPAADPPPAGWTPLRLGLVLAWAAALLALVAVGVGGASLVDLSERRIRFVSAVTHELRTPLTSLRLYLDLLTSGMVTDEQKQKEYLATLAAESERLNQLVQNVLDFARLEKRAAQTHAHPTPVAGLLDDVRATWAERLAADGMELTVESALPADRLATTDPRVAAQVLGNLVDNARKYARAAADRRVWVRATAGDRGRVAFEVEDRGPGVPPRDRKLLFRPFRRGADADTQAGGAGLGLALAKQWAEALGGRLAYRPADGGVGACFRLELPGG